MIQNADITQRLNSLIGKELTDQNLHEALFCENKHKKLLVRFHLGKQKYVQFNVHMLDNHDKQSYADIHVMGNPNRFSMKIKEMENQVIITSDARINYNYLG